ncbi:MAG: Xaa-Pro aminopeptidase [Longicatena sp.]
MQITRRKKLFEILPDNSITLFFSGKAPYKVGDEKYTFSVDRNFYYLTQLDKENMVLALIKTNQTTSELLFMERYDEEEAKWIGGRLSPEAASEISGIDAIYWAEELLATIGEQIARYLNRSTSLDVYADFTKQEPYQSDNEATLFTRELLKQYPYIELKNVAPLITSLRLIKDADEIKNLEKAIQITNKGILNMLANAQAGMSENQLEAYFDFVLKTNGCLHSFPSIVAGAKNASILHYSDNNQKVKDRSLVLCDLGAAYEYMNGDISRTFPINGTFTKRQKEIYSVVLAANKYIMSLVKPGITLRELNNQLIAFYEVECKKIGLLKHGKTIDDYYWHGVSHMLGLETHDVSLSNYELEEGNVFTIEPGLYIEEESIGIRIEDNVLVTKDGCINLSADIIKEVSEIEAFMAKHK